MPADQNPAELLLAEIARRAGNILAAQGIDSRLASRKLPELRDRFANVNKAEAGGRWTTADLPQLEEALTPQALSELGKQHGRAHALAGVVPMVQAALDQVNVRPRAGDRHSGVTTLNEYATHADRLRAAVRQTELMRTTSLLERSSIDRLISAVVPEPRVHPAMLKAWKAYIHGARSGASAASDVVTELREAVDIALSTRSGGAGALRRAVTEAVQPFLDTYGGRRPDPAESELLQMLGAYGPIRDVADANRVLVERERAIRQLVEGDDVHPLMVEIREALGARRVTPRVAETVERVLLSFDELVKDGITPDVQELGRGAGLREAQTAKRETAGRAF